MTVENDIFNGHFFIFILLKRHIKNTAIFLYVKLSHVKIAVFRRLVMLFESVFSIIVKWLAVARRTVLRLLHNQIFREDIRLSTFQQS